MSMITNQQTCADRRLPIPDIREVIITERRARAGNQGHTQ